MSTFYEARVSDSAGNRLAIFANFVEAGSGASLDYVLSVGKIGVLTMTLPATVDTALLPLDGRVSIWRSVNGAAPVIDGDAVFLIRRWDMGTDYTTVTAFHVNDLFARRIVAYYTSSAYAASTGAADDVIKFHITNNLIGGIQATRIVGGGATFTGCDNGNWVSLQANLGQGYSTGNNASWRNMIEAIQEIADTSIQNGTYLTAEIVAPSESTLEARTYATVRGVDHRASSASPVIFSEARGNLKNAVLTLDRTQEVTVAVAGGQGEGSQRMTAFTMDQRRFDSVFNYRETFVEMTNATTQTQLQAAADSAVWAGRPIQRLTADLVELPGCTRGIHFNLGDMVTLEHRGLTFDARLDLVHTTVTSVDSGIQVDATTPGSLGPEFGRGGGAGGSRSVNAGGIGTSAVFRSV